MTKENELIFEQYVDSFTGELFKSQDVRDVIYHCTTKKSVPRIKTQGILPTSVMHYNNGGVYFWKEYERAKDFLTFTKNDIILYINSRLITPIFDVKSIPEACWTTSIVPPESILKFDEGNG